MSSAVHFAPMMSADAETASRRPAVVICTAGYLLRGLLATLGNIDLLVFFVGVDGSVDYPHLRSEQRVIGIDEPWQQIGAFAGEYAAR